ncbi:MAG: glycerophosphodiester phosphodiesterase [Clostridia bacterium]|nr:glycerophosphodiester phosphodiesterase [Clostridia bacterium]
MKETFTGRTGHPGLKLLREYRYAHRGFHDKPQIPENSLAAFKRAVEHGFGAELDIHLTRDGRLVVFHDSTLVRCTGAEGILEDKTLAELRELRLEGTDEIIPTFDEVLDIFENATPLIIELKTYAGNHEALARAAVERLDSYKGDYCIESFDPRAIGDIRKLRPDIVRGQLSTNFREDPDEAPKGTVGLLTDLKLDFISRPDFVAYNFKYRDQPAFLRAVARGIQGVAWTIKTREDLKAAEALGYIPIFEQFDPNAE